MQYYVVLPVLACVVPGDERGGTRRTWGGWGSGECVCSQGVTHGVRVYALTRACRCACTEHGRVGGLPWSLC